MPFKTLDQAGELTGKRALMRVDFNVPFEGEPGDGGTISDDTRLRAALPTIRYLSQKGAKVVLLAHFDRPKGRRVASMSLQPLAAPLSALLEQPVAFADDCIGPDAARVVAGLEDGGVALLENLRFHAGEERNDPDFAADLAKLGDLYVDDAFSAAHRAHASTEAIAKVLPAYAGLAMELELDALETALGHPKRPVLGIVGGSKVSTKLDLLKNLVTKLDKLAIGGGMANTFLYAQGHDVGASYCEKDLADTAREIIGLAGRNNCKLFLPLDIVVAEKMAKGSPARVRGLGEVDDDERILRRRAGNRDPPEARHGKFADAYLERPLGRVRNSALRQGHGGSGASRRRTHQGRQADLRLRRRRHSGGPEPRGRGGRDDVRLHRRRGVPGVDGGQNPSRGRRAGALTAATPCPATTSQTPMPSAKAPDTAIIA